MAGFKDLIRLIVDGELVNAGVSNRAVRELDSNVRYVKEIVETALMGQTLFSRFRTVDPTVNVGHAVFYNGLTQQFERAQAAVVTDPLTGTLIMAPSGYPWGIVSRKLSANKADILLQGVASIDMSNAIDGTPAAGMYFLSGVEPGKLVQQQPPVSVPVCLIAGPGETTGTTEVYVHTNLRDMLDNHKHYRFDLVTSPSGDTTPPSTGARHAISNADNTVEGWLPADDAIFEGKAPQGAVFGYNISVSAMANLWPPIPVDGSYLEWNRGEESFLLGMGVPLGRDDLVIINNDGIWWMSDCYGDVPWPTLLDTTSPVSLSASYNECPRDLHMKMIIWFTKPVFQNNTTCVLSLTPRTGSGLFVKCAGTETDARTGHLEIGLDLGLTMGRRDLPGYHAFKNLNATTKQFELGPVVEGLKAGTDNVTIVPVVGEGVTDDDGFVYGKAVVNVTDSLSGLEMGVETVRLAGAYEAFVHEVIGLGMDPQKTSTFYGRIPIREYPDLPTGTKMKFRFWVLFRETGASPADLLSVSYRRIPLPIATLTPVALPTTDTDLTMDTEIEDVNEDEYVLMETEAFDVAAGDTVMFSVTRSDADGYPGEIDILRKVGILVIPEA